jgi:hypothetical protein
MSTDLLACVADEKTTRKLVTDAMRADGFLPPAWKDGPRNQRRVLVASKIDLGSGDSIVLEEQDDGRVWCWACVAGITCGEFVPGRLADAKPVAVQLLAKKLRRAAEIMNKLEGNP